MKRWSVVSAHIDPDLAEIVEAEDAAEAMCLYSGGGDSIVTGIQELAGVVAFTLLNGTTIYVKEYEEVEEDRILVVLGIDTGVRKSGKSVLTTNEFMVPLTALMEIQNILARYPLV